MVGGSGTKVSYWQTQLPVDFLDTTLTINVWSEVIADLSGGKPAKLVYILVAQTNNGATAEDIELEITLPHPTTGVATAYTASGTLNNATNYYLAFGMNLATGDFDLVLQADPTTVGSFLGERYTDNPFFAKNVGLVRVRQTSTVDGTSAQIEVNIGWEKLKGV